MNDNEQDAVQFGHVKWFDAAKGFGFIVPDDNGNDVLLHANVLRNFGQSSVADGSVISFLAQETSRGFQATEVIEIRAPEGLESSGLSDFAGLSEDEIMSNPLEPARIKWFDKSKGFGFANTFGDTEDIFVHVEVLRRSGLADLQPGEAIGIRVMQGRRGRMAAAISSWDGAAEE